jgi:hypothetical protein
MAVTPGGGDPVLEVSATVVDISPGGTTVLSVEAEKVTSTKSMECAGTFKVGGNKFTVDAVGAGVFASGMLTQGCQGGRSAPLA